MTTMTRWQPFGEFADLHERLDRLFERTTNGEGQPALPAVDVIRRDDAIVIRADMPRIKPDEVKIELEDDVLTVSGKHAAEGEPEEGRRHQAEGRQVSPTAAILKRLQPSYLVPPFEQSRAIGRRS